mmetsp:Transcript_19584/g.50586  ORF Transcript_19584/g.50586 Transcript_19584/m.50586 type:complete len:331 (+) Transcript_19584:194-1186(+)
MVLVMLSASKQACTFESLARTSLAEDEQGSVIPQHAWKCPPGVDTRSCCSCVAYASTGVTGGEICSAGRVGGRPAPMADGAVTGPQVVRGRSASGLTPVHGCTLGWWLGSLLPIDGNRIAQLARSGWGLGPARQMCSASASSPSCATDGPSICRAEGGGGGMCTGDGECRLDVRGDVDGDSWRFMSRNMSVSRCTSSPIPSRSRSFTSEPKGSSSSSATSLIPQKPQVRTTDVTYVHMPKKGRRTHGNASDQITSSQMSRCAYGNGSGVEAIVSHAWKCSSIASTVASIRQYRSSLTRCSFTSGTSLRVIQPSTLIGLRWCGIAVNSSNS